MLKNATMLVLGFIAMVMTTACDMEEWSKKIEMDRKTRPLIYTNGQIVERGVVVGLEKAKPIEAVGFVRVMAPDNRPSVRVVITGRDTVLKEGDVIEYQSVSIKKEYPNYNSMQNDEQYVYIFTRQVRP